MLHRVFQLLSSFLASAEDCLLASTSEGVVERLVHTLRYFPAKSHVVVSATKAAILFCSDEYCRSVFVDLGGLHAVLEAVRQVIQKDREIGSRVNRLAIANCFRTLALVTKMPTCRSAMCQHEHLSLCTTAVKRYGHDDAIAESIAELFYNISTEDNHSPSQKRFFFKSRLILPLVRQIVRIQVKLLSSKSHIPKIAEHTCASLFNVCSQGRMRVVTECCENLLELAQEVVEKHPSQDEIVNVAVSLVMLIR